MNFFGPLTCSIKKNASSLECPINLYILIVQWNCLRDNDKRNITDSSFDDYEISVKITSVANDFEENIPIFSNPHLN